MRNTIIVDSVQDAKHAKRIVDGEYKHIMCYSNEICGDLVTAMLKGGEPGRLLLVLDRWSDWRGQSKFHNIGVAERLASAWQTLAREGDRA